MVSFRSVLVLFLVSAASPGLWAEAPSTKPAKGPNLTGLASTYKKVKTQLVQEDMFSRQVLGALYKINKTMKKHSKKRGRLTDRMLSVKGDIKILARKIAGLEGTIGDQRKRLSRRLRALYVLGGEGGMHMLFSASSASEFDRNLKFLKIVTDRDYELIKDYEGNLTTLQSRRHNLKVEVKKLVVIKKDIKQQEQILENQQASKAKLLTQLKKKRQEHIQQIKGIRAKTKQLLADKWTGKIDRMLERSFFEQKSALKPPVEGYIVQPYGLIQNSEFRFKLSHKGLFFAAPKGASVQGVYSGKVAYVGDLPGYGKTVIIDHGDHYYSVYGHNSNVKVRQGQLVKGRQEIAKVGTSGGEFGSGLYFEIRHFSDAVDPVNWLANEGEYKQL